MELPGGPPDDRPGGGPPPPPPPGSGGPPPPPGGSGGPPPPPPPPGGAGPQSPPPGPQSPGQPPPWSPSGQQPPGQQWGTPGYQAPPGYGPPGYPQPGYPQPGYGQAGYGIAYGPTLPPALQGHETASYGARAGAYLLDTIIFFLLLFTVVGWIFVPSLVMARKGERNGQTWGKQVAGIKAVKADGSDWSFGDAFVREWVVKWLLFGFLGGFFFIPPFLDLLWPLWDERDQALHDKVVNSYVIKA